MMNLPNGCFENGGPAQPGGRTLRNLFWITLALLILVDAGGEAQGQRVDVPMVSDRWQQVFGNAEFKQHKGAAGARDDRRGRCKAQRDHVS